MIIQLKGDVLTKGFLVSLILMNLHPLIFAQDEVGSKNIDSSYFFDLDTTESQIAHYKKHAGSVLVNPIMLDSHSDDSGYDDRGERKRFVAFNLDPMFPPYSDVIDRLQVPIPIEQKLVNSDTVENTSNQPNEDEDIDDPVDGTEGSSIKYDTDEEIGIVDSSTVNSIGGSDDMWNEEEMKGKSVVDEECHSNGDQEGHISNDSSEHEVVSVNSINVAEDNSEENGFAKPQNETVAIDEILNTQHETDNVKEHASTPLDGEKTPYSSQEDEHLTKEKQAIPADKVLYTTQNADKVEQEIVTKEETHVVIEADESGSLQYEEIAEVDDTTSSPEDRHETKDRGEVSSDDQLDGLKNNVQPDDNYSEGSVMIEVGSKNLANSDESDVINDEGKNDSTDEAYASVDSEVSEDTENEQAKHNLDLNGTTSDETMKIAGEREIPEGAMDSKQVDDRVEVDGENYGDTILNDALHKDEGLNEVLETFQSSPESSNATKAIMESVDNQVDKMLSMQEEKDAIGEKYHKESDSKLHVSGEHMRQDEIEVSSDIQITEKSSNSSDDESITVSSIQSIKEVEDEVPKSKFDDDNEVETNDLSPTHVAEVDPTPNTLEEEKTDRVEETNVIDVVDDVEESKVVEVEDDVDESKHIESGDEVEELKLNESKDDVEESKLNESKDDLEELKIVVVENDIDKSKFAEVEDDIDDSQIADNVDSSSKVESDEGEEPKKIEAEEDADESESAEMQDELSSSANTDFVVGLDDIHKFFEDVDPPDELDPGAGGLSLEEVLKSQGIQIIKTRMNKSVQSMKKGVTQVRAKFDKHFGNNEGVQAFGRWCANTRLKIMRVKEGCVESARELLERFKGSDDFEPLYDEDPEDEKILEMRRKLME